ncbi:Metal-dependent_phosphoesterase [Hexamita inflata]|uniref:Metal-dependent phosphoesterase n=1 Tax=Hexamita inflata TaxID=28002 RepID=A0AA86QPI2_9EUKA|nr:Metal-dependent phosphoesterase [Hexamita inflata]
MKYNNIMMDLHTHTIYSDGKLSPDQIVKRAIDHQIDVLAITDHDTLESYKHLTQSDFQSNITIIPGVELTTKSQLLHMTDFHLVVLFPQLALGQRKCTQHLKHQYFLKLQQILNLNSQNRTKRMKKLIQHLITENQLNISWEEFFEYHLVHDKNKQLIQKYSIAKYLISKQIVDSVQQAFDLYLNYEMATSKPLILEAMIKLAVKMRAVPILAHPLQSTKISSDLTKCFSIWQKLGLKIIEIEHPTMSISDKEYLKVIAKQNNFYQSIASDFHSDERSQNWQSDFGNSEGNLRVSNQEKIKTLDYIFSAK